MNWPPLVCGVLILSCVAPLTSAQGEPSPCSSISIGLQPAEALAGQRMNLSLIVSNRLAESITVNPGVRLGWETQSSNWGPLVVPASSVRAFPRLRQVTDVVGDYDAAITASGITSLGDSFTCPSVTRSLAVLPVFPLDVAIQVGSDARLIAQVVGGVPPYTVTWMTSAGNVTGVDYSYSESTGRVVISVRDASGRTKLATYDGLAGPVSASSQSETPDFAVLGMDIDRVLGIAQIVLVFVLLLVVLTQRRTRPDPAVRHKIVVPPVLAAPVEPEAARRPETAVPVPRETPPASKPAPEPVHEALPEEAVPAPWPSDAIPVSIPVPEPVRDPLAGEKVPSAKPADAPQNPTPSSDETAPA